jgi:hypothetical protein
MKNVLLGKKKTHNLSENMFTKIKLQIVPDYVDMMILCWGQHFVTERLIPVRG